MQTLVENKRNLDVIFKSNGMVIITSHIAKLLNLLPGDTINVLVYDKKEYLLVANHVTRDDSGRPIAKYKHAVRYVKKGKGTMRCYFKELCICMNFVTQAEESHLFCGTPKTNFMRYDIAIPLITSNNQFGK